MEQSRICRVCKRTKPISEFYPCYTKNGGRRRTCKRCFLKQNKEYQLKHRAQKLAYLREYHKKNKTKTRVLSRKRQKERLANDPVYKAKRHARLSIWKAFNSQGMISQEKIKYWVGCSSESLTKYLKQTWLENYGEEWSGQPCNIDHITPLVTAKTEEEVRVLCHYSNLRLVTPEENFAKGIKERGGISNKIIKEEDE